MAEEHKAVNKIIYAGFPLIDLTKDTVDVDHLLKGTTAHDKSGKIITGTCSYDSDTSDGNATASEILIDKTAYVMGSKIIGTMPNRESVKGTISNADVPYQIQDGYHDGGGTVSIDPEEKKKLTAGNIKSGITILGVVGDYSGEPINVQPNIDVTPTVIKQVITHEEEYDYLGQVTVLPIPYSEIVNDQGGRTVTIGRASSFVE